MVKQIPSEVVEKLAEQGKHVGKSAKGTPKTVFQRMVGERTDEEKKAQKDREEAGIEDTSQAGGQQTPGKSQTDVRRSEIEAEEKAKRKKMQKILHRRLFDEAQKVRKRNEEEKRLRTMKEEEEKREKEEKKTQELEQKEKEEALAVKVAKRARGAGEFGPKKPK